MTTATLETAKSSGKAIEQKVACGFSPDCHAVAPESKVHYQGSVALCPACYDRWFYLQED